MPTPVSATPEEIWTYYKRFVNIEKILEGLDNTKLKYSGSKVIPRNSKVVGVLRGTGNGNLILAPSSTDDLIAGATETILDAGFDPTNIKDHDDDTYSDSTSSIGLTTEVEMVKYDLGSIAQRVIYLVYESIGANAYRTDIYNRVYISDDDVSYTLILDNNVNGKTVFVDVQSFRYIKLATYNASSSTSYAGFGRIYTLEVYDLLPLDIQKEVDVLSDKDQYIILAYDGSANVYYNLYVLRGEP